MAATKQIPKFLPHQFSVTIPMYPKRSLYIPNNVQTLNQRLTMGLENLYIAKFGLANYSSDQPLARARPLSAVGISLRMISN